MCSGPVFQWAWVLAHNFNPGLVLVMMLVYIPFGLALGRALLAGGDVGIWLLCRAMQPEQRTLVDAFKESWHCTIYQYVASVLCAVFLCQDSWHNLWLGIVKSIQGNCIAYSYYHLDYMALHVIEGVTTLAMMLLVGRLARRAYHKEERAATG